MVRVNQLFLLTTINNTYCNQSTKVISMPCGLAISFNSYNNLVIITFLSSCVSVNVDETKYFKLNDGTFHKFNSSVRKPPRSTWYRTVCFAFLSANFSALSSTNCMLSPFLQFVTAGCDWNWNKKQLFYFFFLFS